MRHKGEYFSWGLTAFLVIVAVLIFYDIVFRNSVLVFYFNKLATFFAPAESWLRTLLPQAPTAILTLTTGILGFINCLTTLLVG